MNCFNLFKILCLFLLIFFTYNCASLKEKNTEIITNNHPESVENSYIKQELIIKLISTENISNLEKQFSKYKLTLKKEVSKSMGIWLVQYDTTLIKPKKMLKKLQKENIIVEVEFNKKLNSRR